MTLIRQAIIFLLEEYLKQFSVEDQYGATFVKSTPEEREARELLEELKGEDIHNDPELEGRL